MELLIDTSNIISELLERSKQNEIFDVRFSERVNLYSSFGSSNQFIDDSSQIILLEKGKIKKFILSEADKTLGWLAILTGEKVLPFWEKAYPYRENEEVDDSPRRMLQVGRETLLNSADPVQVSEDLSNKFYWSMTGIEFGANYQVQFAGETIYKILSTIIYGLKILNSINPVDDNNKRGSSDFAELALKTFSIIDPNPLTGYYNEIGSPLKPPTYDTQLQRIFWIWWLTEAIPEARELAHQSVSNEPDTLLSIAVQKPEKNTEIEFWSQMTFWRV